MFFPSYVTTPKGFPELEKKSQQFLCQLTPAAAGTSQTLAGLAIPQEHFEALPFAELFGPRIKFSNFILVGHPLNRYFYKVTGVSKESAQVKV